MRQAREDIEGRAARLAGRALWRRSRAADAPEDEEGRLLDVAGYADGLLDPDEHDRVAALLASDRDAAADVAMARALAHGAAPATGIDHIVARAISLGAEASTNPGRILAFAGATRRRLFRSMAQWGSLAAAVALACWLGFAMGTDASLALSRQNQSGERAFLPELFDPSSGFLRDPGEDSRT
jgi:anti-sigma factor RsiW